MRTILQSDTKGLSLVEIALAMGIMAIVVGVSMFIFLQIMTLTRGVDTAYQIEEELWEGLNWIRRDMRETSAKMIDIYDGNVSLNGEPCNAWLLSTGCNQMNFSDFHIIKAVGDDTYKVDWQAVVIYCPYKYEYGGEGKVIGQLRRYWVVNSNCPFTFESIDETYITIKDKDGASLEPILRNPIPCRQEDGCHVVATHISKVEIANIDSACLLYKVTLEGKGSVIGKNPDTGEYIYAVERTLETGIYPRN